MFLKMKEEFKNLVDAISDIQKFEVKKKSFFLKRPGNTIATRPNGKIPPRYQF